MNVKERILSIRLIEKLSKSPKYAKRLVIRARMKKVKSSKESERAKSLES